MRRKRIQQFLRYAIRIRVQKADPQQVLNLRQAFEQLRQAVAKAQILAVGSRVLADQGNFARASSGEILRFTNDGFKTAAAKCSAQLRNDAEGTGMIAAFGDLDVRGVARGGNNARRQVVIEKRRRCGRQHPQIAMDSFKDALDFAGSYDGIDLRNLLENLVAKAFDETSGDDEFARRAKFLVLGHFQNGVHGLFLRRLNEAARVDDKNLRLLRAGRKLVAFAHKHTHHHLAIHKVLRASQADESDLSHRQ